MDVIDAIRRYGASALAAETGVTMPTVTRASGSGRLADTPAGRKMRVVLEAAFPDDVEATVNTRPNPYDEARREDIRIKRLKAEALERKAAIEAGDLIPAAEVKTQLGAVARALQTAHAETRRVLEAAHCDVCRAEALERWEEAAGEGVDQAVAALSAQ